MGSVHPSIYMSIKPSNVNLVWVLPMLDHSFGSLRVELKPIHWNGTVQGKLRNPLPSVCNKRIIPKVTIRLVH